MGKIFWDCFLIKSINKKTSENELISFSGAIFYKIIWDYPEAFRDIRGLKVLHSSLGEGEIIDLTKKFTHISFSSGSGKISKFDNLSCKDHLKIFIPENHSFSKFMIDAGQPNEGGTMSQIRYVKLE